MSRHILPLLSTKRRGEGGKGPYLDEADGDGLLGAVVVPRHLVHRLGDVL